MCVYIYIFVGSDIFFSNQDSFCSIKAPHFPHAYLLIFHNKDFSKVSLTPSVTSSIIFIFIILT